MNHNIIPLNYHAVEPNDKYLVSRSFGNIKKAGTHPVYVPLEQELKFVPSSIIAIWTIKPKIEDDFLRQLEKL